METIKQILMSRDGMSSTEADDLINDAQDQLNEYLAEGDHFSAYEICKEYFNLEPDYLDELL